MSGRWRFNAVVDAFSKRAETLKDPLSDQVIARFSQQPAKVALSVCRALIDKARNQQHRLTHPVLACGLPQLAGMQILLRRVSLKNAKQLRLLPAALLVFAFSWVHCLIAQQDPEAIAPTAQQQRIPDTTNQQQPTTTVQMPDVKTFSGKIVKSGNRFVLQDSIGESTYQLDDHGKAKFFEGKNVRVTGTVDNVTKTITVADLQPEP